MNLGNLAWLKRRIRRAALPAAGFVVALALLGTWAWRVAAPRKMVPEVKAAVTILQGQEILSSDLVLQPVQAQDLPRGAVQNTGAVVGRKAAETIVNGQPVMDADMGRAAVNIYGLYQGQVGVTVKLDDPNVIAGLHPGDWVELFEIPSPTAGGNPNAVPLYRLRIASEWTSGGQATDASLGQPDLQPADVRLAATADQAGRVLTDEQNLHVGITVAPFPINVEQAPTGCPPGWTPDVDAVPDGDSDAGNVNGCATTGEQ